MNLDKRLKVRLVVVLESVLIFIIPEIFYHSNVKNAKKIPYNITFKHTLKAHLIMIL